MMQLWLATPHAVCVVILQDHCLPVLHILLCQQLSAAMLARGELAARAAPTAKRCCCCNCVLSPILQLRDFDQ